MDINNKKNSNYRVIPLSRGTVNCVTIRLLCGLIFLLEGVTGQLPDNGFRNRQQNNNGYNDVSPNSGTQTILEVVKSINYLSEVRPYFI